MENIHKVPEVYCIDGERFAKRTRANDASECGVNVTNFYAWLAVRDHLPSILKDLAAMVFNAQCPYDNHEDKPDCAKNLRRVIEEYEAVCRETGIFRKWYVLVEEGRKDLMEVLSSDEFYQREWKDEYRESLFYYNTKNDRVKLFTKISDEDENSIVYRISNNYRDVFAAIRSAFKDSAADEKESFNTASQVCKDMINLLQPFVIKMKPDECNNNMNIPRQVLERIFGDMKKHRDFPDFILNQKEVNLNWCSLILQGDEHEIKLPELREKLPEMKSCRAWGQMPKILAQCVKTIQNTSTGNGAHADRRDATNRSGNRSYSMTDKEESTSKTSYLIRSFALQLCDILLWYAEYRQKLAY